MGGSCPVWFILTLWSFQRLPRTSSPIRSVLRPPRQELVPDQQHSERRRMPREFVDIWVETNGNDIIQLLNHVAISTYNRHVCLVLDNKLQLFLASLFCLVSYSGSTLTDKFHYQQMQYYYKLRRLPRQCHWAFHWLLGEGCRMLDLMLQRDWLWWLKFVLLLQLLLLVDLFLVCV